MDSKEKRADGPEQNQNPASHVLAILPDIKWPGDEGKEPAPADLAAGSVGPCGFGC